MLHLLMNEVVIMRLVNDDVLNDQLIVVRVVRTIVVLEVRVMHDV